jgi:hypothetical protein
MMPIGIVARAGRQRNPPPDGEATRVVTLHNAVPLENPVNLLRTVLQWAWALLALIAVVLFDLPEL